MYPVQGTLPPRTEVLVDVWIQHDLLPPDASSRCNDHFIVQAGPCDAAGDRDWEQCTLWVRPCSISKLDDVRLGTFWVDKATMICMPGWAYAI